MLWGGVKQGHYVHEHLTRMLHCNPDGIVTHTHSHTRVPTEPATSGWRQAHARTAKHTFYLCTLPLTETYQLSSSSFTSAAAAELEAAPDEIKAAAAWCLKSITVDKSSLLNIRARFCKRFFLFTAFRSSFVTAFRCFLIPCCWTFNDSICPFKSVAARPPMPGEKGTTAVMIPAAAAAAAPSEEDAEAELAVVGLEDPDMLRQGWLFLADRRRLLPCLNLQRLRTSRYVTQDGVASVYSRARFLVHLPEGEAGVEGHVVVEGVASQRKSRLWECNFVEGSSTATPLTMAMRQRDWEDVPTADPPASGVARAVVPARNRSCRRWHSNHVPAERSCILRSHTSQQLALSVRNHFAVRLLACTLS